jgi:hypothetical protein
MILSPKLSKRLNSHFGFLSDLATRSNIEATRSLVSRASYIGTNLSKKRTDRRPQHPQIPHPGIRRRHIYLASNYICHIDALSHCFDRDMRENARRPELPISVSLRSRPNQATDIINRILGECWRECRQDSVLMKYTPLNLIFSAEGPLRLEVSLRYVCTSVRALTSIHRYHPGISVHSTVYIPFFLSKNTRKAQLDKYPNIF